MKKLHLISLGCSKNLVDSEVMLGALKNYDITDEISHADVIIINTCGFINAAKQESLAHIFEAINKRKEGALLVASGCLVARYGKEIKEMIPEIDILSGVGDFNKINEIIESKNGALSQNVFLQENEERIITGSKLHAFIKISEGCNQQCSFCAIPSFKGKLNSRSIASILKEIEILAKNGYKDFSLIAQDSSSYLKDQNINDGLIKLINAIEAQGAMQNARILYLYPSSVSYALLDCIAKSSIFQNYFDMPLQHISTKILNDMNRSSKDVKKYLKYMKEIDNSFVRTSIIAGYPTENEDDFLELCDFLESFKFDRVNVFEYSSEENTKAYNLAELSQHIKNKRIKKIEKILHKNLKELYSGMIDKTYKCIIEGKSEISEHFYSARDVRWGKEIDGEILVNDGNITSDGFYDIKITQSKDGFLIGEVV